MIEIQSLRNVKVIDNETNDIAKIEPRRINVFLDCGTNVKQDLIGALALGMYMRVPRSEERFGLLTKMHDDRLWLYELLEDGLEMSIDGFRISVMPAEEVRRLRFAGAVMPVGAKLESPGGNSVRALVVDINYGSDDPEMTHTDVILDEDYIDGNTSAISLSAHEYLTSRDVEAISKTTDPARAVSLLNQVLSLSYEKVRLEGISVKTDKFGRLRFYLSIPGIGEYGLPGKEKGLLTLTTLALASTNNIVVLDHVEDQLYRRIHSLIGMIAALSHSQWFIGMYNYPMLHSILKLRPNDTMLYVLTREKRDVVNIGVTKGEEFDIDHISKAICLNG